MSTHAPRPEAALSAKGMRFALCATRWNVEIVEQLLAGARKALEERGAEEIRVLRCAGVFELGPLAADADFLTGAPFFATPFLAAPTVG